MSNPSFVEDTVIRDQDGTVCAVVTYKLRPNGKRLYSFSLMREFDDGGVLRRGPWLNSRHAAAAARLIPRVLEYLQKMESHESY